eukprot:TRINITY_DN9_c0_g1_i2.p1 TRINITY_DN9_c0_g1~~TRINITY_DN9_c0_g1_i2.p1  ORF type:complete len:189 (+),score=77.45 TRINITY_DN9_c0_g1_i2:29-568(+)
MGLIDVEQQLAFYGEYHANPMNQWVHIVFVPLILWTSMVFVECAELAAFGVSGSWYVAAVYTIFYVLMDPVIGITYSAILAAMAATSVMFAEQENALNIAIGVHIFSWVVQVFVGHGVFEGRAPSLLDSFFQSLMLAPFFVFMECVFKLGFRKEQFESLNNIVGKRILEYRKQQAKKAN